MALNNTAKHAMLDELGTLVTHLSVHDADPGAGGANELAGSTRQAVSWDAASGGTLSNTGTQEFAIGAGDTVHSVGLWSAATAGTFYGFKALPSPESFSNEGTLTVNNLDINVNDA